MPAYVIALVAVTDMQRYREYMKATPSVIAEFGGKFIVRGGEAVTLEGAPETRRIVILEFPNLEQAMAFYHSPEYAQVKELRKGAATGDCFAVDGVPA
jgi:uncharacterized protein (DUF1330 family)